MCSDRKMAIEKHHIIYYFYFLLCILSCILSRYMCTNRTFYLGTKICMYYYYLAPVSSMVQKKGSSKINKIPSSIFNLKVPVDKE
jgi:hypothetical protein